MKALITSTAALVALFSGVLSAADKRLIDLVMPDVKVMADVNTLTGALSNVTGTATRLVTSTLGQLQGQLQQLTQAAQSGDETATETLNEAVDALRQAAAKGHSKAKLLLRQIGMLDEEEE